MDTLTLESKQVTFKGYTIEKDLSHPYNHRPEFLIYPTVDGVDHDYDWTGESWKYCGNCRWADSIEEARYVIDDILTDRLETCKKREEFVRFQMTLTNTDEQQKSWQASLEGILKETNETYERYRSETA